MVPPEPHQCWHWKLPCEFRLRFCVVFRKPCYHTALIVRSNAFSENTINRWEVCMSYPGRSESDFRGRGNTVFDTVSATLSVFLSCSTVSRISHERLLSSPISYTDPYHRFWSKQGLLVVAICIRSRRSPASFFRCSFKRVVAALRPFISRLRSPFPLTQ